MAHSTRLPAPNLVNDVSWTLDGSEAVSHRVTETQCQAGLLDHIQDYALVGLVHNPRVFELLHPERLSFPRTFHAWVVLSN